MLSQSELPRVRLGGMGLAKSSLLASWGRAAGTCATVRRTRVEKSKPNSAWRVMPTLAENSLSARNEAQQCDIKDAPGSFISLLRRTRTGAEVPSK